MEVDMSLGHLPPMDHAPTSEELRLRVVAQTNGENAALGQRAMSVLYRMDFKRRQTESRQKRTPDAQSGE